nr:MAG TPA: Protein of unknown function (DUF4223) [Caudoviricetes sp.]
MKKLLLFTAITIAALSSAACRGTVRMSPAACRYSFDLTDKVGISGLNRENRVVLCTVQDYCHGHEEGQREALNEVCK